MGCSPSTTHAPYLFMITDPKPVAKDEVVSLKGNGSVGSPKLRSVSARQVTTPRCPPTTLSSSCLREILECCILVCILEVLNRAHERDAARKRSVASLRLQGPRFLYPHSNAFHFSNIFNECMYSSTRSSALPENIAWNALVRDRRFCFLRELIFKL